MRTTMDSTRCAKKGRYNRSFSFMKETWERQQHFGRIPKALFVVRKSEPHAPRSHSIRFPPKLTTTQ